MAWTATNRRMRSYKILRLFFGLVFSFFFQYARARLGGRSYDFFTDSEHNRRRAIRLRTTALGMGGVLIKVGQFLSSRVDLLPTEYIEELALLQDEVPPVPIADICAAVLREFGSPVEDVFTGFDPVPLAAASLGQVHRAILTTGEQIVVKVQRPGIEHIVEADLASLRYIVSWLHRFSAVRRRVNLPLILGEFEETLRMELDYQAEGHHAERSAVLFQDMPEIQIPRIVWSHCTRRILTMQYMSGIKVTDFDALDAEGIDRTVVAEVMMRAYFKQVLEDGFFHADPHPGNILVRPGPVVVFLDFGMVGELSSHMRDNIRLVFLGVIRRDYDQILVSLERLGFFTAGADMRVLRGALIWTINTFYTLSFGEFRTIDPRVILDRFQEVLYTESLQIPADFAFLARALGTLSGLCTALDPSFQFVTVAEPYARNFLQRRQGFAGTVEQLASEARSLAEIAYSLPYLSRRVLSQLDEGALDLRRDVDNVVRSVDRLERGMRRLLHGVLLAAFVVSAASLMATHQRLFSMIALAIALGLLVTMVISFRRRR